MRDRPRAVLFGILLGVTAIASVLFWLIAGSITEQSSRSQIDDLLDRAEREAISTIEISAADIDRTAGVLAYLAASGDIDETGDWAMYQALEFVPELSGLFLAHDDGSFHFVFRTDQGYGTKHIVIGAAGGADRTVVFTERDRDFVELDRWTDPDDDYDPRQRPWFEAARATPGEAVWTDPYQFFTSQQPGVTRARSGTGEQDWVVGVDVQLQGLVDLLDRLSTEVSGDVFLHDGAELALTRTGLVDLTQPLAGDSEQVRTILTAIDGLGEGDAAGDVTLRIGGTNHTARRSSLETFRGAWTLLIDISDDDVPVPVSGPVRTLQLLAAAVGGTAVLILALLMIPATKPIRRLHLDATTDALTGLPNRRTIWERAELLAKSGSPFAVMMIDADEFKEINDVHGHLVGDEVLVALAERLGRSADEVGRVGGEEFLVLHRGDPATTPAEAAERVRCAIAAEPVATAVGPIAVTVSIGVAQHQAGESFTTVLGRADAALLEAKIDGRNRVQVAPAPSSDLMVI